MQASFLSVVLLPLALGVIMMGLGLSLRIDDFKRVLIFPKAVLIGLLCQMILLPVICYFAKRAILQPKPVGVRKFETIWFQNLLR